jgi:hypothetical protein
MNARSLFGQDNFTKTLSSTDRIDEYYLFYRCLAELNAIEKRAVREGKDRWESGTFGQALRYGKFAVVAVCANLGIDRGPHEASGLVQSVLDEWVGFELAIRDKPSNRGYFGMFTDVETGTVRQELNYDGYYKGRTVNADLREFFLLGETKS